MTGCPSSTPPPETAPPVDPGPLRVLVLDDPALADVIEREWGARSDTPLEILNQPSDVLLAAAAPKPEADVLIFPSAMLGQLAEDKQIRPLPTTLIEAPEYQKLEIFDLIRRREMQWRGKPYAVSFGSPQLVLLVRADLVSAGESPQTWTELSARTNSAVGSRDKDEAANAVVPLVQPLGSPWAARILLVRAAPYIYDRSRVSTVFDFRTFEPRIHSPPFVRALEELVEDYKAGPPESLRFSPKDVLDHFLAGKSAMAITWPSASIRHSSRDTIAATPVEFPVRIEELPGATRRFEFGDQQWVDHEGGDSLRVTVLGVAGRLGGIALGARNLPLATTFLGWASGPAQGGLIAASSPATTLFRESQGAQPELWVDRRVPRDAARRYVEIVEQSLGRGEVMALPRVPGQSRYLEVLDEEVRKALRGQQSADEALAQAADRWREITSELGRDEQLRAYRRSLGIPDD